MLNADDLDYHHGDFAGHRDYYYALYGGLGFDFENAGLVDWDDQSDRRGLWTTPVPVHPGDLDDRDYHALRDIEIRGRQLLLVALEFEKMSHRTCAWHCWRCLRAWVVGDHLNRVHRGRAHLHHAIVIAQQAALHLLEHRYA